MLPSRRPQSFEVLGKGDSIFLRNNEYLLRIRVFRFVACFVPRYVNDAAFRIDAVNVAGFARHWLGRWKLCDRRRLGTRRGGRNRFGRWGRGSGNRRRLLSGCRARGCRWRRNVDDLPARRGDVRCLRRLNRCCGSGLPRIEAAPNEVSRSVEHAKRSHGHVPRRAATRENKSSQNKKSRRRSHAAI